MYWVCTHVPLRYEDVEAAILNPEDISGDVGEIVSGAGYGVNHSVRQMLGAKVAGVFLATKYFSEVPDRFFIEIALFISEINPDPVPYIEVGKFEPDYEVLSRKEILGNSTGGTVSLSSSSFLLKAKKSSVNFVCFLSLKLDWYSSDG